MSTPIDEIPEPSYYPVDPEHNLPAYNVNNHPNHERSSDEEEGTVVGEGSGSIGDEHHVKIEDRPAARGRNNSHLTVETAMDYEPGDPLRGIQSPSQSREQSHRLDDDLKLLQIERQVSQAAEMERLTALNSEGMGRSRSRRDDTLDEFDIATNPIHEQTAIYKPPAHPVGNFSKFVKRIHHSSWIVRYITYITPVVLILLVPLLLGVFVVDATVGHVYLVWFMIWLEIVWLTLWAGRLLAKALPWPIGVVSSLFTNNSKKWRDMGKQLELPATLFFWWLGIEVSFLPTMIHHQKDTSETQDWMKTMNKVLVSLFIGAILNFIEKIIIQLIAMSFHLRTYQDRIELNKFQIGSLTKLYTFSKEKIQMEDSEFENPSMPGSGARTPGQYLQEAQRTTKEAVGKFGDLAGKVAGDFMGRNVAGRQHPHSVILALLHSTGGSQVLARRLYRTFAREETETIHSDDLRDAFDNDDEADAAFTMFDKDMNGDISMEELEAVCVEIGRERKSITASLKDLDSVVGKLDDVFVFVVVVIVVLVFISLISTSAAGVLTSAGSSVLALSWLFSATAQEFLQSVIFVFVKHPFDVGDRVTIFGNQAVTGVGDDYFVKTISLLYTEFKKMEGHVVQAPNSYLNTIFVLNQRRSGGLAEAIPITIKFGTTLEQIEGLRNKLLEFVRVEKREYQGNILTELRTVFEAHSLTLNVIFFYKSNWQNEGLRLARRNKFICALMVSMQELGIEGPRMRFPGQKESFPVYLQNVPHVGTPGVGRNGHPDNPTGLQPNTSGGGEDPPFVAPQSEMHRAPSAVHNNNMGRSGSVFRSGSVRPRGESLSQMNKRVDFSLGMKGIASGDLAGDVYESRPPVKVPINITTPSHSRPRASTDGRRESHDLALGRSTSRNSGFGGDNHHLGLARRSTDNESNRAKSVHRNRFFNRHRAPTTADEQYLMEGGMADIPEVEPSSSSSAASRGMNQSQSNDRLDPRTGLVSPAAWRMNTNESNIASGGNTNHNSVGTTDFGRPNNPPRLPSLPGHVTSSGGALDGPPEGYRIPQRSATEDFEMRRFR